jgi:hypothetical protein
MLNFAAGCAVVRPPLRQHDNDRTGTRDADGDDSLSMDGAVRGLAGLGLRRLRRTAVQLCGAQRRAHAAGAGDRLARGAHRHALLDRRPDLGAAARLGRGWGAVRLRLRPHRTHPHPAADHAAVCAGYRGLRLRAEHLGAAGMPYRGGARHRRRMGRRRLDGGRSGTRKPPRRSRRPALHRRADGPVPGDLRELRRGGRVDGRFARDILALRVPVRPRTGRGGLPGAPVPEGARALEGGG